MAVRARKRFGQHFLTDQTVIEHIINEIDFSNATNVVEIGPGRGALTRSLLARTDVLHMVEIDRDLVGPLQSLASPDKLKIHNVDALKFDFCKSVGSDLIVIGNLPYNISTPLLFHLLGQVSCINQMLFMLQKEVADRICASPGTKDYGRLSIMVQCMCHAMPIFDVGPQSFEPRPKVDSTVIRLTPEQRPLNSPKSMQIFKKLVRLAFSKRRKTIRNALKGTVNDHLFSETGIDPATRPEMIDVATYVRLSNNLYNSSEV